MKIPTGFEFPFMRVKPFNGLMIDESIWETDQSYHISHSRLHNLVLHGYGVVQGMEVSAREPVERAVRVAPGMSIDNHGNVIVLDEEVNLRIAENQEGVFYITAVFQAIDEEERFSQLHGGKLYPTRVRDGKNVYARVMLPPPGTPYVELARIFVYGKTGDVKISNAKDPLRPKDNEIDNRYRVNADPYSNGLLPISIVLTSDKEPPVWEGMKYWLREIEMGSGLRTAFMGAENKIPDGARLAYLNADGAFELPADKIKSFVGSGGTLFMDGSGDAFQKSADAVAESMKIKLEEVKRNHPLLNSRYLFTSVPDGAGKGTVKVGNGVIISTCDYGIAWQGGTKEKALPRETIRAALEMGVNIAVYANQK